VSQSAAPDSKLRTPVFGFSMVRNSIDFATTASDVLIRATRSWSRTYPEVDVEYRKHVADVARLPAGIANGVAGVGHFELGQLFDVVIDDLTEPTQHAGTITR